MKYFNQTGSPLFVGDTVTLASDTTRHGVITHLKNGYVYTQGIHTRKVCANKGKDLLLSYKIFGPVCPSPTECVVDTVNHPPHYTSHPSGVECITITEHMGFCLGNAIKYLWRADEKGHPLEDLKKAAWYLAREIAKREKEATS